ncbi:MAG: hypothetical protein ABL998_05175 [Planctomycetota bacterium]
MSTRPFHPRSGLAMIAVLLVLMALFVLCAPFLITVRNADQASSETADRAVQRITLDMGVRHAEALLAPSHPALDATPYFDDLAELAVAPDFPDGFLPTSDPTRPMWDVEALDVAGKIDLASASPHVLANLIGGAARLTKLTKAADKELELSDGDGFLLEGAVYVEQELVHYTQRDGAKLTGLTRGLLHESGTEGATCGPQPAADHDLGAYVIDQRAWALCEWRLVEGDVRAYDGIEELREARTHMLGPELGRDAYLALERSASAYAHVRAGARWQRAVRMLAPVGGAPDYGCELALDDTRWFNAGTTVRISDGTNTEVALVRSAADGKLVLTRPLAHRFEAGETLVSPLARAPVNVNTASPAVLAALWTNLKLRGRSARLTAGEAKELVDVVLASRPFTGFEDFLRRVVLPAGGLAELPADAPSKPEALEKLEREAKIGTDGKKVVPGFLDEEDAVALYKCALNANDNELEFATMPLCFTSRDVYELATRAAVQAPSGVERARGVRETVELVVPQRELLSIWTRQEDFDEAPRLDSGSAGWISGPVPTSRFDPRYGVVHSDRWPTRARAQLGPDDTQPWAGELQDAAGDPHVFAAREDDAGWAQLMPMREEDQARRANWALHFDDETQRLEGRFLPDAALPFDPAKARWTGSGGLLQGLAFSMWVQPRELEDGARLFDLAGAFNDTDRVSLVVEQGELVLRVLDAAGDHDATPFEERSEVRYPLAGEGPGLPLETWSHLSIAVDGSRPDQLKLLVDGRRAQNTPGLTRLTGAISGQSDEIPVESTEGFPDRCVLRIGDELIEAVKKGAKSFQARFNEVGENAGFGGRLARELYAGVEPEELNQGLYKDTDHPSGTAVQLYGYSLPLFSNVPNAQGGLRDELGMFSVARVDGIIHNGSDKQNSAMPPIQVQGDFGPFTVGWGIDGSGKGLDGLLLQSADPNRSLEDTMAGFNSGGGYAAILQIIFTTGGSGSAGDGSELAKDLFGVRIGGVEVVRYRGYSGRTLHITERGDQVRLGNLTGTGVDPSVKGRGAFIVAYDTGIPDEVWAAHAEELTAQVLVIPISIPVGASSTGTGFEPGLPGRSAFAQLTHLGGESHLTEWVRYDEISGDGQLVRDTSSALMSALSAATGGRREEEPDQPRPGGGGGGGGGGPGRGGSSALLLEAKAPPSVPAARPTPAAQVGQARGSYWDFVIGEREDEDFLVARAVASNFQFRGVLGTFIHAHPQGTVVLPVFRTHQLDETAGWPGRFDSVTFLSDVPTEPGFQGLVQHAHRPSVHTVWNYQDGGALAPAEGAEPVAIAHGGFDVSLTHVALQGVMTVPFAATPIGSVEKPIDSRLLTRMTLFPSGELPRIVTRGQLGGDALARGSVPSVTIDEALFFPTFATGPAAIPSQFVLDQPLAENGASAIAAVNTLRTTLGDFVDPGYAGVLGSLPAHGGLLSIGDEILAYEAYDTGTFTFVLPPAGRGLSGTEPAPHRSGEAITFLGALPCAILAASVGPDDALLPLLELSPGFPSQGTVWLEGELVHYTRVESSVLVMPRASSEPGRMDEKGPGLFRGRYGTPRAAHGVGTPVILWPFRYWDRWSELADAPELAYYQLSLEQPDAFWRRAFWRQSAAGVAGPELFVLQRTNADTPWDAPPDEIDPKTRQPNGLRQLSTRRLSGEGELIGVQADRVEWRIHVRHQPGSFDALTGAAHGWKSLPKLELFGVEYLGPSRTYTRSER